MRETPFPVDLAVHGEACCAPAGGLPRRWLLRALGLAACALGLAGAVLPMLPTTPFVLLAAWAFARSSPRLERWLETHPRLGPALAAWRARGAIPRPAKAAAALSLPASWTVLWVSGAGTLPLALSAAVLVAVGVWILTRPA